MILLLALGNLFASGWGMLGWIGLLNQQRWRGFFLQATLAILVGLGFTSLLFFGWTAFIPADRWWYWAFETALALILARSGIVIDRRRQTVIQNDIVQPSAPFIAQFTLGITALALGMVIYTIHINPHGAFDAWAIWNAHARFLFAGDLQAMYQPYATPHADYPSLIPASIARLWSAAGTDASSIAGMIAILMVGSLIPLMYAGLARCTHRTQAWIAIAIVFGTSHVIYAGSSLMADMPLSVFFLATLVCLTMSVQSAAQRTAWLLCGGFCAGFAGWTKNEGFLFGLVVLGTWGVYAWKHSRWRGLRYLWGPVVAGMAPIIGYSVFIKEVFDLQSDLSSELTFNRLVEQLTDLSRHLTIARFYVIKLGTFGRGIIPVVGICAALIGLRWHRERALQWLSFSIPLLLLAGYWVIYLITPHDLTWHLTTSLDRLLVQIWPLIVFGIGLSLRPSNQTEA